MKIVRRSTGVLWIVGGALIGLVFAIVQQQPRIPIYVFAGIADIVIPLGCVAAAFGWRRLPMLIGFLVSAVGWALLAVVALAPLDLQTATSILIFGRDLAMAGLIAAAVGGFVLRRSRILLAALAVGALLYFNFPSVGVVVFAVVLVVSGVIVFRRGFVGR